MIIQSLDMNTVRLRISYRIFNLVTCCITKIIYFIKHSILCQVSTPHYPTKLNTSSTISSTDHRDISNENSQYCIQVLYYNNNISLAKYLFLFQVQICYCFLFMVSLTMSMSIYHLLKLSMLILVSLLVSYSLPSYFLPSFLPFLPWPLKNIILLIPGLTLLFFLDRNQEHVSR